MPLHHALRDRLAERYTLLGPPSRWAPEALQPEMHAARAVITLGSLGASAAMQTAMPELGLICCYGTGFEAVDRAAAAARGIHVTHAGDANAISVAEFTMALVLASARLILRADRVVRDGKWASLTIDRMPQVPGLAGRRIGIYGLGAIGQRVATRSAAFDMEVGYHGRAPRPELPYAYHPSLMSLAEWADVLVVTVRASAENRHAVNEAVLRALGPEGTVVNVARGSVIDTDALCDALETGAIAGAGLDVYETEPQVPERLKDAPNTVLTPHIAALSRLAQAAQQQVVLDNLEAFFEGRPLRSLVRE
ncbi:2-hydroxyacid dehydrogenase [Roseomonas arctica]|uniref:2-hydroxyacid dehydrogenase n=2 Tax=Plastoroseomonas arctica TaxID=1509237 RepID=A0AAF1JY69_9PROT|nr:2-hydroxyacid dehydrogenase [Plastoroseomonas arctica]